jgi:hypothetical protein
VVLLLIPLIHLVYLVSRDTLASLNNSPNAWESELTAYISADSNSQLPQNPVVVVGGKRVKLWPELAEVLAPRPVLMRGLGDAIVDDIIHHYVRLVGFYQPETVVFLPGNSEFHIRDDKSAIDLVQGIQELEKIDRNHEVTRQLVVFAPLKTPLHPGDDGRIEETTQRLQAWAAGKPRVIIIDANALLSDTEGRPRPHYYRSDGVNLNDRGYLRLSMLLLDALEAVSPTTSQPAT